MAFASEPAHLYRAHPLLAAHPDIWNAKSDPGYAVVGMASRALSGVSLHLANPEQAALLREAQEEIGVTPTPSTWSLFAHT